VKPRLSALEENQEARFSYGVETLSQVNATKEYQRAFQNFRYLLAVLQFEDPEVFHYLKKHVKMGAEPAWVDTGEDDGPMA
jgi:hypothetical protein